MLLCRQSMLLSRGFSLSTYHSKQAQSLQSCWQHRRRNVVAAQVHGSNASSINNSSRSSSSGGGKGKGSPSIEPMSGGWNLLFDLRERETEWSEENKARLMAIVTAQQLGISMTDMEDRLEALMLLLPDLAGKIPKLRPEILGALVHDLNVTSGKMLALRDLLPQANVSRVVAERPQLLMQDSSEVAAAVEQLKKLLNLESVDKLVEAQPLLLVTECVEEVLTDIQRLMPSANAQQLLAHDPDWVLRVQRGQKWLGQHPDSDMGELINWKPPQHSSSSSSAAGSGSVAKKPG